MTLPGNILRRMDPADRKLLGKAGMTAEECALKATIRIEGDLQNWMAQILTHKGITPNQSRMDKRKTDRTGWPDFTFAVPSNVIGQWGMPCAVEVKMPGQDLSDVQEEVREGMEKDGWNYRVVHSVEEFMQFLKGVGL